MAQLTWHTVPVIICRGRRWWQRLHHARRGQIHVRRYLLARRHGQCTVAGGTFIARCTATSGGGGSRWSGRHALRMTNRIVGCIVRGHLRRVHHRWCAILAWTLAQCPSIADRFAQSARVAGTRHLRRRRWLCGGWRTHRRRHQGLHRSMARATMLLTHMLVRRIDAMSDLVEHGVVNGFAHILDWLLGIDGCHDLELTRAHLVGRQHANLPGNRRKYVRKLNLIGMWD